MQSDLIQLELINLSCYSSNKTSLKPVKDVANV